MQGSTAKTAEQEQNLVPAHEDSANRIANNKHEHNQVIIPTLWWVGGDGES